MSFLLYLVCALILGWMICSAWYGYKHKSSPPVLMQDTSLLKILNDIAPELEDDIQLHSHLANLYRRNGEIDIAITIRQKILQEAKHSKQQYYQILLDLAQDYIEGGMLSLAEPVLQDIIEHGSSLRITALQLLRTLYHAEYDWSKALHVTKILLEKAKSQEKQEYHVFACHYYCNLAQASIKRKDVLSARRYLTQALSLDAEPSRVLLLQARLENYLGNHKQVRMLCADLEDVCMQALPQIVEFFMEYFPEEELMKILVRLYRKHKHQYFLHSACQVLHKRVSYEQVYDYFMSQLCTDGNDAQNRSYWHRPDINYACSSCGTHFQKHRWSCPVCSQFNTLQMQDA